MSLAAVALLALGVLLVIVAPAVWLAGAIVLVVGAVAGLVDLGTRGA